jgi:hypothetical protein
MKVSGVTPRCRTVTCWPSTTTQGQLATLPPNSKRTR